MKVVIASDIHGSEYYMNKLKLRFDDEGAEQLILLGDLYYHGPRNNLPKEYNPMEVSKLFNKYANILEVIKGNCDAEVDEMISDFKFNSNIIKEISGKRFYFTHGHHQNIDNIPSDIDFLVYGHFHTGFIKEHNGVICINSGSVSLPKNETVNSYLIIDEDEVILKDFYNGVIKKIQY